MPDGYSEAGRRSPGTSTLNFNGGQTRANNAVVHLDDLGQLFARPILDDGGRVQLVVDVFGWFE